MQRHAGEGLGMQCLPRIGQEVLVAFLDGDIDRPLIVGAATLLRTRCGYKSRPAESEIFRGDEVGPCSKP